MVKKQLMLMAASDSVGSYFKFAVNLPRDLRHRDTMAACQDGDVSLVTRVRYRL
jgi:hypothetical protein